MTDTSTRKRRLLVFADANFIAHTSRVVEVSKVLRDDYGYDVVFAGTGAFTSIAKTEGFVTDNIFTVSKEETLRLARRAGLVDMRWWMKTCYKSVAADIDCIEKHQPDLILSDMHWSMFAAAQSCGVPFVSITNAHWTSYFTEGYQALEDHWSYDLFGRFAGAAFPAVRTALGSYYALPYRVYGWQKKLPVRAKTIFDVIEGSDFTLFADIPSFGPVDGAPGERFQYCGPILWEPKIPEPEWVHKLRADRPTIYVTMGSTGDPKSFRDSVAAFAGTPYQVVVTTGGLPVDLSDMPDNVHYTDFAPGHLMLDRSALVVSHGGNGTIYQAISCGTPIIGIPSHIDQEINLQRVEALGVGIKIPRRRFTAKTLKAAVEKILGDSSYQANAETLAKEVKQFPGARLAARHVHGFAERKLGPSV